LAARDTEAFISVPRSPSRTGTNALSLLATSKAFLEDEATTEIRAERIRRLNEKGIKVVDYVLYIEEVRGEAP
jgi:hypothetical protein